MDIDEKVALCREVAEELINEEELRAIFAAKKKPVAYDGFEPSGNIHIAQGLLRTINVNKLTRAGIHFKFYVADWFGMLNNKMGGDMEKIRTVGEYFIEVWRACGMDLNNVEFIWASEFINSTPDYWETVMKLSMNSTLSRVIKCGQVMGREESSSNPASHIFYPLMQAADIHHLGADIAQLGMDQRKVNMLARDIFPKIGLPPPIAMHHHMLMGLTEPKTDATGIDGAIAKKMSKSNPNSAIFMTDTPKQVSKKFNKAYCPEGVVEDNPVLDYCKHIVFEMDDTLDIERPEKFGGNVSFESYEALETAFVALELHPGDLKSATAKAISRYLEPVTAHFEKDARAKELLAKVESFNVTR
ncbi:MAG: tyrosyl-tRNA synthetase [Patescibacteria group bacterium]|jgi:tyrosyl-tRNA synthetase